MYTFLSFVFFWLLNVNKILNVFAKNGNQLTILNLYI